MAETATKDQVQDNTTEEESDEPKPVRNPHGRAATELAAETGRKLGSRVTARQYDAVVEAFEADEAKKPIEVVGSTIKALKAYAQTGERDALEDKEFGALRGFVETAKTSERLESESQRRRLWPRKVAAILVHMQDELA